MLKLFAICLLLAPPLLAYAVDEVPVQFEGDHVKLAGTLALPTTRPSKVPAVLLLQGSGPTDRDGNQGTSHRTDLLKQIANGLAEAGIASLRFDKRGLSPGMTPLPTDRKELEEFCKWDHFVNDDLAAERYLAGRDEIDASRVGILGHSEGGMLALIVADQLQRDGHAPAELMLLSTPGRPPQACLREQIQRLIQRQQMSAERSKFFTDAFDRIVGQIQSSGQVPDDVPAGLAALFPAYLGPFLQGQFGVDPAALAKGYSGPVLIVAGAADAQVSPTQDAGALDAALATRKADRHRFVTVPNATHPLKPPGKLDGPVVPEAMEAIVSFSKAELMR